MSDVTFNYDFVALNDIRVNTVVDEKGKKSVESVVVDGESLSPSKRFWTSVCALYGISPSMFKYYQHEEVFDRIASVEGGDQVRYCIARHGDNQGELLAVSRPEKPIVVYEDLMEQLEAFKGYGINYHDGVVESMHAPRVTNKFSINDDDIEHQFLMSTPIDGYGMPNIYLSLLRDVCQNCVIGYSKAFKTGLALGKGDDNVIPSIIRALDGFNSDEGYAAIRSRMERAAESWMSVREATDLYKIVTKLMAGKHLVDNGQTAPELATSINNYLLFDDASRGVGTSRDLDSSVLLRAYHKMTGDVSELYGLANMDALSVKRQQQLPVKCSLYDGINYATEIATHFSASPEASRQLNNWVGMLLGSDFDMEGTKVKFGNFADLHMTHKLNSGMTGSSAA